MTGPEQQIPGQWFEPECRRCERLAANLAGVRDRHPDYFAAPVPPFGELGATLQIVGLAPGMHGANATGRPFTGDFAGVLLYETLYRFGFSSAPESRARGDGLVLYECRITNAVKCLPPENKPTGEEVRKCNPFLRAELEHLRPGGIVLALGLVAHNAALRAFGVKQSSCRFGHGEEHVLPGALTLLDSYHCSRYNTQTGRLTEAMFQTVVGRARELVEQTGAAGT